MRLAVIEHQHESIVSMLSQKPDRVFGHDVNGETLELFDLSVDLELRILRRFAAGAEPHEISESELRRMKAVLRSQMPFADQAVEISGFGQQLRPCYDLWREPDLRLNIRIDPIGNAQFRAITAGDQARARRRTNRR